MSTGRSLTDYTSYRDYLKDILEGEKTTSKGMTLQRMSKSFGMSAPLLQMILSGSRNLQLKHLLRIARTLRLSFQETEYFEALVALENVVEEDEAKYLRKKLKRIEKTLPMRRVRMSQTAIIQDWRSPALLVHLVDRKNSDSAAAESTTPEALASAWDKDIGPKLGLSPRETRAVAKSFVSTGLVQLDRSDRVHVVFEKVGQTLAKKNYIQSVLKEAANRVEREFDNPNAAFRTHTFSIAEELIPQLAADYRALLESYMAKAHDSPPSPTERILQTAFQAFPIERLL